MEFDVEMMNDCEYCDGTGSKDKQRKVCDRCQGTGHITVTHQLAPGMVQQMRRHAINVEELEKLLMIHVIIVMVKVYHEVKTLLNLC